LCRKISIKIAYLYGIYVIVPDANLPVRIPRGSTCFTIRASPARLAATFSRHQLKVILSAEGGNTLGICRIPLALLLSANPTTSHTSTGETTEVQTAKGTAECTNESGSVFGRVAFRLQLKRLPPGYTSPVKSAAVAADASAATSAGKHGSNVDGKDRMMQVRASCKINCIFYVNKLNY
jgi:hypothetical protein